MTYNVKQIKQKQRNVLKKQPINQLHSFIRVQHEEQSMKLCDYENTAVSCGGYKLQPQIFHIS